MRILIAEDEQAIRDVLADVLADAGHEVTFATTYRAAESLLGAGGWDLMLADRMMPDGDGLGLAETARARGLRVVRCTGLPRAEAGLAVTGIRYLQKPFSLTALLHTIAAAAG